MKQRFNRIVDWFIRAMGSPSALSMAAFVIVAWAVTGPIFGFSDTWQLAINTGTTIVTFLMVFVIQNAQNRDAKAVHIKLDELIRALDGARDHVVLAEHQTEEEQDREIEQLKKLVEATGRTTGPAELAAEAADQAAGTSRSGRTAQPTSRPLPRKQTPTNSR